MNIFQRYRMPPTNAQSVARASFGPRPPQLISVMKPDVVGLFNKGAAFRAFIDGVTEDPVFSASSLAVGLGGLGRFGEGGTSYPVWPNSPYAFSHDCPYHYFTNAPIGNTTIGTAAVDQAPVQVKAIIAANAMRFPMSVSVLNAAAVGYDYIQTEIAKGNQLAKANFDAWDKALKDALDSATAIAAEHNVYLTCDNPASRPWEQTSELYKALAVVADNVQLFANATRTVPPATISATGTIQQPAFDPSKFGANILSRLSLQQAQDILSNPNANIRNRGGISTGGAATGQGAATGTGPEAAAASHLPSWLLPAAALGVVGAGIFFFVLKK